MLDDFKPIIHEFPAQNIRLFPLFDLHIGSPQFDRKMWDGFKVWLNDNPDVYLLIGGDLMDNGIKSSVTSCYEATMRPSEQKRWLAEELKPFVPRILCGTGGNHEARSAKDVDDNPLYDVFCKLNIEHLFRENACFLFLRFGERNKRFGNGRTFYSVMVTHGAGGGSYIGSSANKLERFGSVIDGLDLIVTGHTHKPITFPVQKLVLDPKNKQITYRDFRAVVATSWLTYGGYALKQMLTPAARTHQEIHLNGTKKEIRVLS